MNLNIRSKKRRNNDVHASQSMWHRKFAILPRRINDETVIVLGWYYRKGDRHTPVGRKRTFEFMTVDEHQELIIDELRNGRF